MLRHISLVLLVLVCLMQWSCSGSKKASNQSIYEPAPRATKVKGSLGGGTATTTTTTTTKPPSNLPPYTPTQPKPPTNVPPQPQPAPPTPPVTNPTTNPTTVMIGPYTKDQVHFKVQIGAFKSQLSEDDDFWEGVIGEDILEDVSTNGYYRYSVGMYKDLMGAEAAKKSLIEKGYAEAFLVGYGDDNQRIGLSMQKIIELYQGGN